MSNLLSLFKFRITRNSLKENNENHYSSLLLGWNKKGNHFLSIERNQFDTLSIWDMWNNKSVRSILMKGNDMVSAAYNEKIDRVALVRKDNKISFYDISYDIKLSGHLDINMRISGIKYSLDGKKLLIVSEHNLYSYDLEKNICNYLFHNDGPIHSDLIMPTVDGVYLIEGKDIIFCSYEGTCVRESCLPDEIKHSCLDSGENIIFFVYSGSPHCLYSYDINLKNISYLAKSVKIITGLTKHPELSLIGINYDLKKLSSSIYSFHYSELINTMKKTG